LHKSLARHDEHPAVIKFSPNIALDGLKKQDKLSNRILQCEPGASAARWCRNFLPKILERLVKYLADIAVLPQQRP
jgi:hypothetical protein